MKTVRELKEELSKFPDDALCSAYDGGQGSEGIFVQKADLQGFIYCSESDNDRETEPLSNVSDEIV